LCSLFSIILNVLFLVFSFLLSNTNIYLVVMHTPILYILPYMIVVGLNGPSMSKYWLRPYSIHSQPYPLLLLPHNSLAPPQWELSTPARDSMRCELRQPIGSFSSHKGSSLIAKQPSTTKIQLVLTVSLDLARRPSGGCFVRYILLILFLYFIKNKNFNWVIDCILKYHDGKKSFKLAPCHSRFVVEVEVRSRIG
jgi:hypothetical protein